MNYRHHYHAGNFADVVKHAVLAMVLAYLGRKPTPYFVLDSHAGIGCYDLSAEPARRTGEAALGLGRVLAAWGVVGASPPTALYPYFQALGLPSDSAEGQVTPLRWYPGSPRIARALMRPRDRLVLAELHPEDAATLKQEFSRDVQVAVHHQDGYQAMKAHLPPSERRGVVLIDPPYEAADEAARAVAGLSHAYQRWPSGLYVLWYPIKERSWVWRWHEAIVATGIPRILTAEVTLFPEDNWQRLNGCGLILVNPPWCLDETLGDALHWLHTAFATGTGGVRVEWLVPEQTRE